MKNRNLPIQERKCATCPFRIGSKYSGLSGMLAVSALSDGSRICHSTGSGNAIHHRTGVKPKLCRGARDIQLSYFTRLGFIKEPTDAAWAAKRKELGV